MRKAHERIIKAFVAGKTARDVSPPNMAISRLHTDGRTLYSYAMPIAKRERVKIVQKGRIPLTARFQLVNYEDAPTVTTRAHVRACEVMLSTYTYECTRVEASALR